ncbi:MAG: diaminopropionate ammonia-lyase [Leptolyngbya sp. SIO1D8]|nr:diaminopropionate ammonia-lyase [Leptolyngbya sp. SIO1D8]
MNEYDISWLVNKSTKFPDPFLLTFANLKTVSNVSQFHRSLPNYTPTPLVNLSQLASLLGIKKLFIKDESHRFDLNAFKVLGASYAIAKYLAEVIGLEDKELEFNKIIANKTKYNDLTFVTATDGNHGRAIAWVAKLFGCESVVYMPKGSSQARLEAIRGSGAEASITMQNYDDTVIHAKQMAQEKNWVLLQDTSWEGYEKVPQHIMQGYFTLITESLVQETDVWPTHVFLQAGVGSLAASIVAYLCNCTDRPTPRFIIVEPQGAPCLYESIKQGNGNAFRVAGDLPTIMAGLACGEPSRIGWEILKNYANAFLTCSDDVARRGMKVLGNPIRGDQQVISGESGAVTLGALFEVLSSNHFQAIKDSLNLNSDSIVLLFSTEGDTDPEIYRNTVWR